MRKHFLGFLLGLLTFAAGVLVAPRFFFETGRGSGMDTEHNACSVRLYSSLFGEDVVLWSCEAGSQSKAPRDDFESEIQKYKLISRTDSRAVASYKVGELQGFCVLRFNGHTKQVMCGMAIEPVLDFDEQYFGPN